MSALEVPVTESNMAVSHLWEPIDNLPAEWETLCREDLHAVRDEWESDRTLIKDPDKVSKFQERLANLWAIETGVIEGLYPGDRGLTVALLETGLGALGQFAAEGRLTRDARALIEDQRAALDMVMDVIGGTRALTSGYIKELHHRLTLNQEYAEAVDQFGTRFKATLIKGEWKSLPNNPTRPDGALHEYCPPDFVQDEIEQLLRWHDEHESQRVCAEVEAAWLHHRFTQIHPFQDGNGRVARALTAAVFLKHGYLTLVIRDKEHRERYLVALEAADGGDLRPLVDLFTDIQLSDLRDAMDFVRSLRGEPLLEVAQSVAERARRRQTEEVTRAEAETGQLVELALLRLEEVAAELERQFKREGVHLETRTDRDAPDTQEYWTWQVIESAQHDYYVDTRKFRRWVRLRLRLPDLEQRPTNIFFSFHAVGQAADLRSVTCFLSTSLEREGESYASDSAGRWDFELASATPFRYRTRALRVDDVKDRFRPWLEDAITSAVDLWGRRL